MFTWLPWQKGVKHSSPGTDDDYTRKKIRAALCHSRVIGGHGLGRLAIALDGLHGGGVENPLGQRAFVVSSNLADIALPLTRVQHMHPQQQTVVHDLKALQHLTQRPDKKRKQEIKKEF